MIYNYCTLFDKGFLNRGVALHDSLMRNAPKPFTLFILCMDDECHALLEKLSLPNVRLISLSEFEKKEPDVFAIKSSRTHEEYCWTLASALTEHVMKNYTTPGNTSELAMYVDSDLYFFSPLDPIFELFGKNATLIIPHNLPKKRAEKEESVGKYNVGMVIFRNDADGRACLSWWRDRTVEWCYSRVEPGRFGDQKYLDFFEEKFRGVYVLNHEGSNLAPWCIENFVKQIRTDHRRIMIGNVPLIFFHFSSFKIYFPPSPFRPSIVMNSHQYGRPSRIKKIIYNRYKEALYRAMMRVREIEPHFTLGTVKRTNWIHEMWQIVLPIFWWRVKDIIRPILKPLLRGNRV